VEHIEHITRLIIDICGGEAGPLDDQVTRPAGAQGRVKLRVARAAKVIGMPVSEAQVAWMPSPACACRPRRSGRHHRDAAAYRFDLRSRKT
jgi:hypothetical protein